MKKKIKVGIIGTGFGLYGLYPAFLRDSRVEVVGIAGRNIESAKNSLLKRRVDSDLLPVFSDYKTLIESASPDAIAIALPPFLQEEVALYAFNKKLAVFAEKPLATSVTIAKKLCEAAQKSSRAHMVDFMFSEIDAWKKTKECLANPTYAPFHHIYYRWFFESFDYKTGLMGWKTDSKSGGGLLRYFSSHVLYNLEFLGGKIKSMRSRIFNLKNSQGETAANLEIQFQNGMSASVQLSCVTRGKIEHVLDFIGDQGTLTLENKTPAYAKGFSLSFSDQNKKSILLDSSSVKDESTEDERVAPVSRLAKKFLNWMETGQEQEPNFNQALRVQELIDFVERSQEVFIPTS